MELLIVEQNGWSKPVKITKAITRLGSDPSNDIQLQDQAVAPVHLQVLYSNTTPASCKIVNLAEEITTRVARQAQQLAPFAVLDLCNGDEVLLGQYWITFSLPMTVGVVQSARMIDATLSFDEAVLRPGAVTTGLLTVKNAGLQPACQFEVELSGLPADCYQIDPLPLMYPGAQEEVRLRIFHRGLRPAAGNQQLTIHISAPETYPGEEIILQHGLQVVPVFKQDLELVDDLAPAVQPQQTNPAPQSTLENVVFSQTPAGPATQPTLASASVAPQPEISLPANVVIPAAPTAVPAPVVSAPPVYEAPEPAAQKPPTPVPQKQAPAIPQPVQDISRLKVVRGPADADNFWDDK